LGKTRRSTHRRVPKASAKGDGQDHARRGAQRFRRTVAIAHNASFDDQSEAGTDMPMTGHRAVASNDVGTGLNRLRLSVQLNLP